MFSYELKIKPINSASNLKAFVSVTIDGVMEIDGFKVINGKNGLFSRSLFPWKFERLVESAADVFRPVDTAGIGADYEKRQRSQYTQQ